MGMRSGDFSLPKAWGPKSAAAPATVGGELKPKTPLGNREGGRTLRPESQETCRRERCYPARRAGRRAGPCEGSLAGDQCRREWAPVGSGTRPGRTKPMTTEVREEDSSQSILRACSGCHDARAG